MTALFVVLIIMSEIAPKQNASKLKIAPHKQKSIAKNALAGRCPPLANGALCLSTHMYNAKPNY
jgi:hypothetical protein